MDSIKSTILSAITDAQHQAAVSVILPVVMSAPISASAVKEWLMFRDLASLWRHANAPKTVLAYPMQFAMWLCDHPEIPHAKEYAKHIADFATQRAQSEAAILAAQAAIRDAEININQARMTLPGQNLS